MTPALAAAGDLIGVGHVGSARLVAQARARRQRRRAGTLTPGTTGSTMFDGIDGENCTETLAVPDGFVCANAQSGCGPPGAAIVTRIREPARYTCPS